ncbi:unnamed protein product [Ectocarpus sp. CCAP 1310/34]|nr:unnamed protein product [Ectocarpus sp. CCAP 1310/34]
MPNPLMQPDIVFRLMEFVGGEQYIFFAGVSRTWRDAWEGRPTTTRAFTADTGVPQLSQSFKCGLAPRSTVCRDIAALGRLDLLVSAREQHECPWDEETCSCASENGHADVLRWAFANGCPWDADTCTMAARHGHLGVLKWARSNGCDWNSETSKLAAVGGHIEVIQYLHEHGCSLDADTCYGAARAGHLKILMYLRAHGCEWYQWTTTAAAAKGYLIFFSSKWMRHGRGCELFRSPRRVA